VKLSFFSYKKTSINKIAGGGLILILLMIFQLSFLTKKTWAATYTWNQTDWSLGLDNNTFPNHANNQTGWTKYFSKDANIQTDSGSITLSPSVGSVTQTSDGDFNVGTLTNVVTTGGGAVQLKIGDTMSITAGDSDTCALKTDGTVWCWGKNNSYQLGIGVTTEKSTPVQVLGAGGSGVLTGVASLVSGYDHNCALKTDGTVWCWGNNNAGQMGTNNTNIARYPIQTLGAGGTGVLTGVSKLFSSSMSSSTCALKTDNTIWCWGYNNAGQIGVKNTSVNQKYPMQVLGAGGTGVLTGVTGAVVAGNHVCAIKNDNTVWCWGANTYGELGVGSTSNYTENISQVLGAGGTGTLTGVNGMTGGAYNSCVLKTDNSVWCWGENAYGQLGIGNTVDKTYPTQVLDVGGTGTLTGVNSVSSGSYHTCALKADSTVWCWGANNIYQLGNLNGSTNQLSPVQVIGAGGTGTLTNVVSLASGATHNCTYKADGSVWCWGDNNHGQVGNNTLYTSVPNKVTQVLGVGGSGKLSLKVYYGAGSLVSSAIDLGQNSALTTLSFGVTTPSNTTLKFQMRTADSAAALSSATWYGPTGTDDYYTSIGSTINTTISGKRFVQYKAFLDGDTASTPILNDITVNYNYYDFPNGSTTQTSDSDFGVGTTSNTAILGSGASGNVVLSSGVMSSVVAGSRFSCALKTDGTVWCWGRNSSGQLGINNITNQTTPVQVLGVGGTGNLTGVVAIAAGDNHICALKTDGTLYCWGYNANGQLGINNITTPFKTPVQVLGVGASGVLSGVSAIAAGGDYTCAIKTNGTLYCWGYNGHGQIGINNTTTPQKTPVQVLGAGGTGVLTGVTSIGIGIEDICAVKSDGTTWCWGFNYYGQLGDNTIIDKLYPTQVLGAGGSGVKAVSGGTYFHCAVKTDGTTWCWGSNSSGQLGINNTTDQKTPVQVLGVGASGVLSGVSAIANGNAHTCALKTNGTVYCWGVNGDELGSNTYTNPQKTPIQVMGAGGTGVLTGVNTIASGNDHNCIIKSNNGLFCWGANDFGQIGDNTTVNGKWFPVQVLGAGGSGTLSLTGYPTSGNFTSSVIDLGVTLPNLTTLSFGATVPANTTVSFQMRSGDTSDLTSATWYGPTSTGDYYTSTGGRINAVVSGKRYVQYKAFLTTTNTSITPVLNDITVNYKLPILSSSLISSPYDTASDANLLSKIEWIKSTPTNTAVKFQVRTAANSGSIAGANWMGPDGTANSYFTDNLGINDTMPAAVNDSLNDRWVQYKTFLETTDTSATPILYDTTTTYVVNAPPSFNQSYQTNGFGITAGAMGTINFLYSVGDTDTDQASIANKYKIWPTFQYTLDNGGTWTTIIDANLTGPNASTPIGLTSPSTFYTGVTTWNAALDLPNSYNTVKVRMILNDHEAANNTAMITSDQFVVDTKKPDVGTPDGGGTGININHNTTTTLAADKTNSRNVTLYFSATDNSAIQMKYSTDPLFAGTTYSAYADSVGFTLPTGDGSKRVYVKFKDYYGNETDTYSDVIQLDTTAPTKPASLFIQDISNSATGEMRTFVNWGKNSDTDWLGYKIYKSTDGTNFNLSQTINNINTNYILDTGVTNAVTYTYKITAIDDLLNESVGSTLAQTIGGNPSDAVAPTITNIQLSNKTTSSVTITWTTNEVANSTVLYSTDSNYNNTQGSAGYTKNHSVTLAGLSAGTPYNFKVRSADAAGNPTDSNADIFTTDTADIAGPIISLITPENINESGATITFKTSELASSFIEYGTTSGFSNGNIFGQNDAILNHSVNLRFLNPNTVYYYKVRSSDISGNETISSEGSFTTLASSSDKTPPVVTAVTATNIKYNTATISFTTDEKASSFVEFGKDTSYGRIYGQDDGVTNHSIILPYDLKPATVYDYRIRTKDTSGNETTGANGTFTTADDPNDMTAPIISEVTIGEAGKNSVTVSWTTDEVANSYLGYSEDLSYDLEQGNPVMTKTHSITLVGLKPKTQYFFRIKSADPSGNLKTDNNSAQGYSFVTADGDNPPTIFANQIKNVGTSSAEVYWETNVYANSYVEYGVDQSYGNWAGINNLIDNHTVKLSGLLSGVTYDFRVRSKSATGSEAVSQNYTLTTAGIAVTETPTLTPTPTPDNSPSETTILDSIKNGTTDFVKKVLNIIPDTKISESDFVDTLNSMSPKIVSSPSISSSNITVDPGVDKITISWTTDKKSNSVVAYAADKEYDSTKSDPYTATVGNPDESVTDHSVEISSLNPNTTYHYQVKSKSEFGNGTNSTDFTFTTLSINSEIRDLKFNDIGEKSINVSWQTNFESRAMIEIIDAMSGKSIEKSEEKGFDKSHNFKASDLQTSTNYKLKIITVAKDGTLSKESIYPFATSTSSKPPEISNVRISNALISGAVEQVQTIVSWKTDKPSTSRIVYDDGSAKELKLATSLDKSLVTDHIVVTTVLKPGKVYKFKTESVDTGGNISLSKDYIIMTPKPQESVINLIISNFTQSFSFITGNKK
jgi:alpha-tubulin suppressor-like RCC1 family protein